MYIERGTKASVHGGIAVLLLAGIFLVIHSVAGLSPGELSLEAFSIRLALHWAAMAALGAGVLTVALSWLHRPGTERSEPIVLAEAVRAEH